MILEELLSSQIPLFAALSLEEKSRFSGLLRPVTLQPGKVLLQEGTRGDRLYFILEGQVEIVKATGPGEERFLGARGQGEFLGEMSLLNSDGLCTASVRAASEVKLLEMSHANFEALLRQVPALAQELLRVMSLRLREANEATLRDLREKNRQLAQAYQELLAAQAQIIEKEKLVRELELARDIQMSYMPYKLPQVERFDFGARMLPARAVGGDFYDFIPLKDGRIGIVVADVSDKGMPAAIMMALTRSILRAEVNETTSPGDTLRVVNGHVLEMNESGMFVTMLYGILDPQSGALAYARAGHEFPFLVEPGGKITDLPRQPGQPVGILTDPKMDEQFVSVPAGSTLLIFTDGLPDAMNSQGEFFGLERLQELASHQPFAPAQEVCDRLIKAIQAFQGVGAQFDDMTLVVVRAK